MHISRKENVNSFCGFLNLGCRKIISCGFFFLGGDTMTLNLIFITVTIRRNAKTLEQQLHDEQVKERFEELNIKKAELHITHL